MADLWEVRGLASLCVIAASIEWGISSDSPETRGEEGSQGTEWMKGRGLRTRIVARFFR